MTLEYRAGYKLHKYYSAPEPACLSTPKTMAILIRLESQSQILRVFLQDL